MKSEDVGLIVVQLVSEIFNLCGHDPPTSQTDRRTDGHTTCDRKTTLCTVVHRAVKISEVTIQSHHPLYQYYHQVASHSHKLACILSRRQNISDPDVCICSTESHIWTCRCTRQV